MPGLFWLSLLPCIENPSCRQITVQLYTNQLSTIAQKSLSMCWQTGGQAISEAISVSLVRRHLNFNLKPPFLKGGWLVHSLIILSQWGSTADQLAHSIRGRTCDSWFPSFYLFCGEQTCPHVISKDLGHPAWVIFPLQGSDTWATLQGVCPRPASINRWLHCWSGSSFIYHLNLLEKKRIW